jgi:F-type H+-transporting ATPase subunit gamma
METTEGLRKRIRTTEDLQAVVKTMKAMAAVNIRHYQRAVEALAEYHRTIELGLRVVLRSHPEGVVRARPRVVNPRVGAIVFGSDQGMCGALNEQVASHATAALSALNIAAGEPTLVAVGQRVARFLEDAGQRLEECLAAPSSAAAITVMVQDLVIKIEAWQAMQGCDQIMLCYNRLLSGGAYRPETLHLLPVDVEWLRRLEQRPWPSHILPIFTMEADRLFSALMRQYLFVSLYRALAESLASENASRLAAMQAAERNIVERLEELNSQFHRQRQMSITDELLDIVAGYEALSNDPS